MPRAFTTFAGTEQSPTFSPDGSEIAFSWNGDSPKNYDLYARSIETGELRRLTSHPLWDKAPKWSPRGDQIAFIREDGFSIRHKEVMLLDLVTGDETHITTLLHPRKYGLYLDWTSTGQDLLVTRRNGPNEPYHVERIALATRQSAVLTQPDEGALGDIYFSISPDDSRLALARCETGRSCDVYVKELRSGALTRLTHEGRYIEGLCWTPDGNEIIFASARSSFKNLWRIRSDGGAIEQMTFHMGSTHHPSTGPGSRPGSFRAAYQRGYGADSVWRTGGEWPAQAESLEPVVAGSGRHVNAALAPAEDRVVYESDETGRWEIWINVFTEPAPRRLTRLESTAIEPAWSSDGTRIVFVVDGDIWAIRADGEGLDQLTSTPWQEQQPQWAPDGDAVYAVSTESGTPQVWRIELSGEKKRRRITEQRAYDFAVDSADQSVYFTTHRDLPTGLWRADSRGGPATLVQEGVRGGCWTLRDDQVYFFDFRDNVASRYLPRDILSFDPASGKLRKAGTISRQKNRNLLLGFDYGPRTGRFYWSQRDLSFEDIWIADVDR